MFIKIISKHTALTLPVPIPDEEKKIKFNFYFHTYLRCLKRFYEGLKGPYKTFWGALKAFIKPFEEPQRSVKTKI